MEGIWNTRLKIMGEIKTFQDLEVWREGHAFVLEIYSATRNFPTDERFGLVSQMRRAAVSITSNIAEALVNFRTRKRLGFIQSLEVRLEKFRINFSFQKM